MLGDDWRSASASIAGQVSSELSASLTARPLTDKLTEFVIHPSNIDATDIRLTISQFDVIVSAGRGTQFELPPLPQSETTLIAIVRAIGGGNLSESIRGGLIRYQLLLADGTTLQGRSMKGLPLGRRTSKSYSPYSSG